MSRDTTRNAMAAALAVLAQVISSGCTPEGALFRDPNCTRTRDGYECVYIREDRPSNYGVRPSSPDTDWETMHIRLDCRVTANTVASLVPPENDVARPSPPAPQPAPGGSKNVNINVDID